MTTVLAPTAPADLAALTDLWHRAEDLVAASRAPSTRASYSSDWRQIQGWCAAAGLPAEVPMPPTTLAMYVAAESQSLKGSTLSRRLAGVKYVHAQVGLPSPSDHPQVRAVLAGVRRERQDTTKQARPLYLQDVAAAVAGLGDGIRDTRDRALLLTGWWAALRRSEVVGLDVDHVEDHPQGMVLRLGKTKSDQQARDGGRRVAVHYRHDETICPVRALRTWLQVSGTTTGACFRPVDRWGNVRSGRLTGRAVAAVVAEAAVRLGFDPAGFSGHSLRAGYVSECDRRGIGSAAVMAITGHKSVSMLSCYSRPRQLFDGSAGAFFDD